MKLLVPVLVALLLVAASAQVDDEYDEEEFSDVENVATPAAPTATVKPPVTTGIEDDETFDDDGDDDGATATAQAFIPPPPTHRTQPVDDGGDYRYEILALLFLCIYAIAYAVGSSKNKQIAQQWEQSCGPIVEQSFEKYGGDKGGLIQESANEFVLFGAIRRPHCSRFSSYLSLIPRHDLVGWAMELLQPRGTTCTFQTEITQEGHPPLVLAVMHTQHERRHVQAHEDLAFLAKAHPGPKFGLSSNLVVLTDNADIASIVLDKDTQAAINDCEEILDLLHISDQRYAAKVRDNVAIESGEFKELPKNYPQHVISTALGTFSESSVSKLQSVTKLAIHLADKVTSIRLNPQVLAKQEKKRKDFLEPIARYLKRQKDQELQDQREQDRIRRRKEAEKKGGRELEKLEKKEERKQMKKRQKMGKSMMVRR